MSMIISSITSQKGRKSHLDGIKNEWRNLGGMWKRQLLSWFFPYEDGRQGLQLQGTGTGLGKSGQWKDCLAVFAFYDRIYQSMFVDKNNPEDRERLRNRRIGVLD